ncbi:MAG: FAD:protein FMN transferase [Chloroflexi bacterium]|nr:FAD:protein FMN transferase [Chloroflexota bacterium]
MQRIEFRAMGCQMIALVDSDEAPAAGAVALVPAWFERWESSLSRFRPESELSRLNRQSGQVVPIGDVMFLVLQCSLDAAHASGGVVTPAVLDALQAAGYDRSFESLDADRSLSAGPAPAGDWRAIELDPIAQTVRVPAGMHLDLGGIAKGWAADQAVRRLSAYGPALVDAGGDISVSGALANGQRWPIAVANPLRPESDLALLMVREGGVATSGRDYRRWYHNGAPAHHIVDPDTGEPAITDVLAASVIAPTARQAEMAAKVAFILGGERGIAWLDQRDEFAGLLVRETGETVRSRRFDDYVWSESLALIENSAVPAWS